MISQPRHSSQAIASHPHGQSSVAASLRHAGHHLKKESKWAERKTTRPNGACSCVLLHHHGYRICVSVPFRGAASVVSAAPAPSIHGSFCVDPHLRDCAAFVDESPLIVLNQHVEPVSGTTSCPLSHRIGGTIGSCVRSHLHQ